MRGTQRDASSLVVAEHNGESVIPLTYNTLAAARQLGGDVTALVAGPDCGKVGGGGGEDKGMKEKGMRVKKSEVDALMEKQRRREYKIHVWIGRAAENKRTDRESRTHSVWTFFAFIHNAGS